MQASDERNCVIRRSAGENGPMAAGDRSIGVPRGADPIEWLDAVTTSDGAPSARNLIVTLFGDLIGTAGRVSVRSIGDLLESFGVNDRLARTSLSRLVGDGLLAVERHAGRAFYGVARESVSVFGRADTRIYRSASPSWDGVWSVIVIDPAEGTQHQRAELRRELGWAGFGNIAPNVMVSATVDAEAAGEIVARVHGRAGGPGGVLVTRGPLEMTLGALDDGSLARRSSSLDGFSSRYASFADGFAPLLAAPLESDSLALKLRLLVVAEFRRIALADPGLPDRLLPDEWPGYEARRVATELHSAVAERAEQERDRLLEWAPGDPVEAITPRRFRD